MNTGAWVAVDVSTDLRGRALELARIHDQVAGGGQPPASLRAAVRSSWERCASSGFDPGQSSAPLTASAEEATERWREHPLSIAEPLLRDLLADVRCDDDQVVLACDADGSLLWIDGEPAVLDAAHEIKLEPGALWSETAAGTNAMGTALAVSHPIQIFSAEHYSEPVHGWTCSAAPVRDPDSGELLGVIDLSGEASTAHPHSLALVTAAARMVETELRVRAAARRVPELEILAPRRRNHCSLASEPGALRIEALGRNRARIAVGNRWTELSPRHSELVVLLELVDEELDADRLACELYGDLGVAVSARAELSRLRRILGDRLASRGPALVGEVRADFAEVERLTGERRIREALAAYRGPLLAGSEVPLIAAARERLELSLRDACIASREPRLLQHWLATPGGRDDIGACRALVRALEPADPARSSAVQRLRRLSAAEG